MAREPTKPPRTNPTATQATKAGWMQLMAYKNSKSRLQNKDFVLKSVAAGDKSNDKVPMCYVYRGNSLPHEMITFEKVLDKMLYDVSNETKGWIFGDYFTSKQHFHKKPKIEEVSEING